MKIVENTPREIIAEAALRRVVESFMNANRIMPEHADRVIMQWAITHRLSLDETVIVMNFCRDAFPRK